MTDQEKNDHIARREERERREAELIRESEEDDGSEMPSPPTTMVRQMMAMFGFGPGGRSVHPVFDKFEPEHVDKFLDHSHAEDMERLRIRRHARWFTLAYVVLVLGVLCWLIQSLLPNDKDLLAEIVKLGVAFAGGVGGGYGLKSYQESRRQE